MSLEKIALDMIGNVLDEVASVSTKHRGRHKAWVMIRGKIEAMGYRLVMPRNKNPGPIATRGDGLTDRRIDDDELPFD